VTSAGSRWNRSRNELGVSLHTAKTHVGRLLTKLGARDRTRLVVLAYESGVVRAAGS
jgi:DNA-binding NarL/FixJ family response regulator